MAVVLTQIEQDINECIGRHKGTRCRIFVDAMLDGGADPIIWWIYNGMSLNLGSGQGSIDMSSRVVCCPEHEDALIARGGWDGTGERQNKEVK